MKGLPIFDLPAARALLTEACERAGVPLATLEALAGAELAHVGQARRHGLPAKIDTILGTVTGEEPSAPLSEAETREALALADIELRAYRRSAEEQGEQGRQAAELAARVEARIGRLRAQLPQQSMVPVFTAAPRRRP